VFAIADGLIVDIYKATNQFPASERYGLQAQIRRAAVSIATNIVEGCARRGGTVPLPKCGISAISHTALGSCQQAAPATLNRDAESWWEAWSD